MKIRILNALVLSVLIAITTSVPVVLAFGESYYRCHYILWILYAICLSLPEILLLSQRIFYPKSFKQSIGFIIKKHKRSWKIFLILLILLLLMHFADYYAYFYIVLPTIFGKEVCFDCRDLIQQVNSYPLWYEILLYSLRILLLGGCICSFVLLIKGLIYNFGKILTLIGVLGLIGIILFMNFIPSIWEECLRISIYG